MTPTDRPSAGPAPRPAERLEDMAAYEPPAPGPHVDLALDANVGVARRPSSPWAFPGLGPEDLSRYPSTGELDRALARLHGVDADRVVVTNGADDAIDRVCRAAIEPGREAVLHRPTFEMIERGVRLAGGEVRSVAWQDGQFPVRACVRAIGRQTSLVALVSPNNPTGGVIPRTDMLEVVRAAGRAGALVLIDLAYVEFADEDPTRTLLEEPNAVVVRTFSKARGLAGARVGYALASPEVAQWLRTVGGPYPVSSVSAALALASLGQPQSLDAYVETVRAERGRLAEVLRLLRCEALGSQANFVTARCRDARFVRRALGSLGIAVRGFPSHPQLDGFVRITLPGNGPAFERLADALRTVLAPEAMLFDLDGVLADVSGSYRAAIIRTARSFGVEITRADICAIKQAGGANNDWDLTTGILRQRGVRCERPDVIDRFQRFYLGQQGEPGLREHERLIPDHATLSDLSQRFKLGIVTGRPRAEAEWFLERAGVRGLFPTLVCMEDAPAKPSPEPVRLAIARLGVASAWMVGDTPDDMVAARHAGVLPIGVTAPGDDSVATGDAMRRAGAAAVLNRVSQIGEMIR